ncbi:TPA: DUF2971 domain-containing protein [Vibrio parahaemolyticus]|nr:DUF2971 domain-containing protein [Vibrio parahaemolyticus]TBT28599.1 DUF2971 domain-containing protein [Vibrio parahaemolyticus]HCG7147258.1 DUF2971 domain-containing protein [Vibrio parahaemolyticus]
MLEKIYKYMPLRREFFDNFLIRGSQKYALNDPFELRPSSGEIFKKLVDNAYYEFAIVSLSETNNNLLMWSHYANQHKGIVIEFDTNYLLFENHKPYPITTYDSDLETEVLDEVEINKRLSINSGEIQRVRYNSKRPSYKDFENILEHFLVKSDEWIYEKEHRIILPLVTADRIVVHESHLPDIEFFVQEPENLEREELPNNMVMINLREALIVDAEWLIRQDDGDLSREELVLALVDNTINEYLQRLSEDPRTIFLYKVDPIAIKSVYFGCKVDSLDKGYVIDLIKSNRDLKHIEIFHAEVSDERFELNFKN